MKHQGELDSPKIRGEVGTERRIWGIEFGTSKSNGGIGRLGLALGLLLGSLMAVLPAWANPDVIVIDRLNMFHSVDTGNTIGNITLETIIEDGTPPGIPPDGGDPGAGNILGGYRKVWLNRPELFQGSSSSVDPFSRTLAHNNGTNSLSTAIVTWDGTNTGGALGLNFELGLSLNRTCPEEDQEIALSIPVEVTANRSDLTFTFFNDSEANRSEVTRDLQRTNGILRQVIRITRQDIIDGGLGAFNIADPIGAFRLTSVGQISANYEIQAPIVFSCGTDFGDAPATYQVSLGSGTTQGGGLHFIGGPFLGLGTNDTDSEDDGQPSPGADFDAGDEAALVGSGFQNRVQPITPPGGAEDTPLTCDGVSMISVAADFAGDERDLYCVTIEVSNPTNRDAVVAGWIDFQGNGTWNNSGAGEVCGTSANGLVTNGCERSSARVYIGDISKWGDAQGAPGTCGIVNPPLGTALGNTASGSWADGNVPPNCEGHVVLVWDLSNFRTQQDHFTANDTYARFRISTDTDTFLSASGPTPCCTAVDGEVEDWLVEEGTIPVSIHAFESQFIREGLEVIWSTASETHNKGFYIWGETSRGGFELLTPEMIVSTASDIADPQKYRVVIPQLGEGSVRDLIITAVDYRGDEEMYGYFRVGDAFGEENHPDPIDWGVIRSQVEQRLSSSGHAQRGEIWQRTFGHRGSVIAADFLVNSVGMQKVTYEDLVAAGLDLSGVNPYEIAVTVNGEAVPRFIQTPPRRGARAIFDRNSSRPSMFGPGSAIYFWGERPAYPDALYVEHYVYRVHRQPNRTMSAKVFEGRPVASPATTQLQSSRLADRTDYNFSSPAQTPWFMRTLRSWTSNGNKFTASFDVPELDRFGDGTIRVQLSGLNTPTQTPNHRVQLFLNGQQVHEQVFSGLVEQWIDVPVRGAQLTAGANTIEIRSVGFDGIDSLSLLHAVELQWAAPIRGDGNMAFFAPVLSPQTDGVLVPDVSNDGSLLGFARTDSGLYVLEPDMISRGTAAAAFPAGYGNMEVWVSGAEGFRSPVGLGGVMASNLTAGLGDFVIIGHPAFLPQGPWDNHPLNRFVNHRQSEGWSVSILNVADIQMHYGGGMPLPGAVTRFLAEATGLSPVSHVLLVGGDSYDYLDDKGAGSISFIPTVYAPTSFVNFTPSDALLADLSGDGLSDLALGRWPVRTLAELETTVQKVFDWEQNLATERSAVFLTDLQDPRQTSFSNNVARLAGVLADGGWNPGDIDILRYEDFGSASGARNALFSALAEGRTLTGYSGHGSTTVWSFQGVVMPNHVANLDNEGLATLVGTQACYTTYFVSPSTNTLAHRLMNGMRINSAGDAVPATNGAVAVHGAATLSSLAQNEQFVRGVMVSQLGGHTLGEAILYARQEAAERRNTDLVINWTLLGDPTLRLR